MSDDLYEVIAESIEDSELPAEPAVEETEDAVETPDPTPDATPEAPAAPESVQVTAPVVPDAPDKKPAKESFSTKYGIPETTESGRENRIPYSRVKKIAEKAAREKVKELEATYTPKITEFETKVKDYEGRLEKVAEFEKVMVNQPDKFLRMLSQIPAYSQFFKQVEELRKGGTPTQPTQAAKDDMPGPDQELSDGTRVYSLDGLKALNAWNRAEARKEVMAEVEKRYSPMESEWQANQKIQAIIPQVQAQIADARTWPMFNENEEAIVTALRANQQLSLEGAYRQVVWPKMTTDRNKMREEILKEVKQAPRSTSVPAQSSKAVPEVSSGPRKLEDIIAEQIKTIQ